MMFESRMVGCLKANGKVLREHKDIVYVPFGTEYSVLLKNLNSVRAMVKVSIDGKDIADGKVDFIVNANTEIDLTRFLVNGNKDQGNKFKFIERTAGIEQHRGIGVEDGIIRIEFQFERQSSPLLYPPTSQWRDRLYYTDPVYNSHQTFGAVGANTSMLRTALYAANGVYADKGDNVTKCSNTVDPRDGPMCSLSTNDAGITVPGSISDQKFHTVSGFDVDGVKHVMVLRLVGETAEGKKIIEPVTVKAKPKCITCGRVNKAVANFCTECGTSLTIV